ncbi:hypothetical protein PQI23_04450 [Leucobacter sp. USCH14]|uniref:hypothetical protein n=1 Tax=Leucobacter sp. USCH14 TaxID=3024838 RepID=UPI0030B5A9C5
MHRMGLLFPEEMLSSEWFGVFATVVAINTLIYVVLGVSKLVPIIRFGSKSSGRNRRAETRSIYPEAAE